MMRSSQPSSSARKRKRQSTEKNAAQAIREQEQIREQEHILYGDQLLDYFMTVGDAPDARRIPPPVPPASFQVDRPIDESGNTALHWACAMGDLDIVRDLVRRGADVRALSVHEETPLVRAVLFTNNYEKRTFPELLEVLIDTISFRDWFGATIFHHIAETTRSKGKWKSSRYYCEVLLDILRRAYTQEEIDLLLSIQDSNGDTAALVAARNGVFRLVSSLLTHCPRAGDLVNKKGETANGICERAQYHEREAASSTAGGADRPPSNNPEPSPQQVMTSMLTAKIESIVAEANKKLFVAYGGSKAPAAAGGEPDDVENPEELYLQLELDRSKIRLQIATLQAKESTGEPVDAQLGRYDQLRKNYASLLEQVQRIHMVERSAGEADKWHVNTNNNNDPVMRYHLALKLVSAQKKRITALQDLIQQRADAGASTKFDVHRKLVSLATGLKEEELDPMSAELADMLEFERMNGKPESPGPTTTAGNGQKALPVSVDV